MCQWFVDVLVLNLREECLMPPCGAAGVYVPQPKNLVFMGFRKMLNLARPLGLASNKGSWAPSTYNEISDLVSKVRERACISRMRHRGVCFGCCTNMCVRNRCAACLERMWRRLA